MIKLEQKINVTNALLKNDYRTVITALHHGLDPNYKFKTGESLVHVGIEHAKGDYCFCFLLDELIKRGLDVNVTNKNGQTPLHYAAKNNFVHTFNLLMCNNANTEAKDRFGKTPIDIATENQDHKILSSHLNYNVNKQLKSLFIAGFPFVIPFYLADKSVQLAEKAINKLVSNVRIFQRAKITIEIPEVEFTMKILEKSHYKSFTSVGSADSDIKPSKTQDMQLTM